MYRRRRKTCETQMTVVDSISISGHEMILYPRTVLYDFMLRKRQQRKKNKEYNYTNSLIQRRLTTVDVAASRQVDVNWRNRHRRVDDVNDKQGRGDGIRAGGRSKSSSVDREQSVEQEDLLEAATTASSSPVLQLSVRVRSVIQCNQQTDNMTTAAAATALTHATREPIQSSTPERLLVTTTAGDMKNNSLFSSQRQCSENESSSNISPEVLLQPSTQQQQCYLNSTYDILFQRHVDTLNKVISDSAAQIENLDNKKQQQHSKVKQPFNSEQKLNFVQQQHQQIRISVSSSEEVAELDSGRSTSQDASSLDTDSGTLEERRSPPAAGDCSSEIGQAIDSLNIDPSKPRIVLSQQPPVNAGEDPQRLSSNNRRSRSPSPLLEVPIESVDISREIRRPPIQ